METANPIFDPKAKLVASTWFRNQAQHAREQSERLAKLADELDRVGLSDVSSWTLWSLLVGNHGFPWK